MTGAWQQTLCVANCAASHHSSFKTADELCRYWFAPRWGEILPQQIESLSWEELSEALRCKLSPFIVDGDALIEIGEHLEEDIFESELHELDIDDAVRFRLQCQLTHSILLEADKAFLIIDPDERELFRHHKKRNA